MSKHLIKGFIIYRTESYWAADERVAFRSCVLAGEVPIREHSFEIEIPDSFDPRPHQVAALDAKIVKTRAEFAARINELQEQKNKLLALEMAP